MSLQARVPNKNPVTGFVRASFALACAPLFSASTAASAVPMAQPLHFFEGRTESVGTMKVMMKKPYRVRSLGRGTIAPDGSLTLVQEVHDDGQPAHQRTWRIRQTGPRKYSGSMSDASGPVAIDEVGNGYRFRFKMRGNLAVEEWLIPNEDGKSGKSTMTIRMYGMKVALSEGTIRKLPD
jgi:hypothetical protein